MKSNSPPVRVENKINSSFIFYTIYFHILNDARGKYRKTSKKEPILMNTTPCMQYKK